MEREKFKSRLGFILISAGCAIGIGNVWRFPYVVGSNGGGIFVIFYLLFLAVMGIPIMTMEFSVGRASKKSVARAFNILEKPGSKWHLHGYVSRVGNYLLMMYYTTVSGWMFYYFVNMLTGTFDGHNSDGIRNIFSNLTASAPTMLIFTLIVILVGFGVCSLGLQKGVEKLTKVMMLALLAIMVVLAVNSIFLSGGLEGLKFYLLPNYENVQQIGVWNVIAEAMNQAFFTLSLGMGSMTIFGSYLNKEQSLLKESFTIAGLDTFVAIVSGLIIFPACFAYNVSPDSGPSLIFITLPNIFNAMPYGRLCGALFFLFMTFAAFSTVIAVFENIMSFAIDLWGWTRKKSALVNIILVAIGSLPCVLGFNLLSGFQPLAAGNTILDLEDFIVSTIILPLGSLVYVLFCTSKYGWGWDNYSAESNSGSGIKLPRSLRWYFTFVLPAIIILLFARGIWKLF